MARKAPRPDSEVLEFEPEDVELTPDEANDMGDLADLDSPTWSDWEWNIYRLRTAEDMARSGTRSPRVWISKRVGPINLNEIQADYGGGWFEFWGKKGGVTLRKFRRELEGEPKLVKTVPTPTAAASSAPTIGPNGTQQLSVDEAVRRALARQRRQYDREKEQRERDEERRRADERFARLEQMIQAQASAPRSSGKSESMKDMIEALVMLKQLNPDATAAMSPLDLLNAARSWMDQGIMLGEKREPGAADGGAGWTGEHVAAIVQSAAQVLQRFTPAPRRGPAPPPGSAAGPSVAEVLPDPPKPAQDSSPLYRWKGAIEAVARGMVNGKGPDEMAATVEDLLNEEELANLKGQQMADGLFHPTAAEALGWLETQGLGKFPQLESPGGLVYLDSVLAEVRSGSNDTE